MMSDADQERNQKEFCALAISSPLAGNGAGAQSPPYGILGEAPGSLAGRGREGSCGQEPSL